MKKILGFVLALALVTALPGDAQQLVQQSSTDLMAAQFVGTTSGSTQQTLTITPGSNNCVYIVSMEIVSTAVTAAAASALTHTTTNLAGMKWFGALTAVAGTADKIAFYPGRPLKSSTCGTAVTVVSNAAITNVVYNITATYYFAP